MGALPKLVPVGGKTCHQTFDSFIVDNRDPLVPRVGGESCDSSRFRFVWIVDNRDPLVPRVGGESCDSSMFRLVWIVDNLPPPRHKMSAIKGEFL